MGHRVFVYGTLLRGELNHGLLAGATCLGAHRTEPCFTLYALGGYPGLVAAGTTAVSGEVYGVNDGGLRLLDQLEGYPRLFGRRLIQTPFGRAWVYLYRGAVRDRPVIHSGDWRDLSRSGGAIRSMAIRNRRDPNDTGRRHRSAAQQKAHGAAPARKLKPSCYRKAGKPPRVIGDHCMSEEQGRFTIHLEQREGYEINVRFDWKRAADLLMDEPPPLGGQSGPNASRLLAAAAANCLSASLLYCLAKEEPPENSLRAEATCILVRNDKKRLRIGGLEVKLIAGEALTSSRRFDRCKDLFEDFCVVSASIREGIPIAVTVVDEDGNLLHSAD